MQSMVGAQPGVGVLWVLLSSPPSIPAGIPNALESPHLPDPQALLPPPAWRRPLEAAERPRTLEFAPRPRPSPARPRLDPWKLVSGQSRGPEPPGGSSTRPSLLDMDVEGQTRDSTVPLCCNLEADASR